MPNCRRIFIPILSLLTVSLVFSFQSCKPDDDVVGDPFVSKDVQAYVSFDSGATWVFEEPDLGLTDTLTCIYNVGAIAPAVGEFVATKTVGGEFKRSLWRDYITEISVNSSQHWGVVAYFPSPSSEDPDASMSFLVTDNPEIGASTVMDPWGERNVTRIDTIINKMSINNIECHDVVVYSCDRMALFNMQKTVIYMARNLGIVRYEFPDSDQVWTLVDTIAVKNVIH